MDDGYETPLVLNTFNVNDPLPINVKDPVYNVQNCFELEKEQYDAYREDDEIKLEDQDSSMLSFQSIVDDNSTFSADFEEQALGEFELKNK